MNRSLSSLVTKAAENELGLKMKRRIGLGVTYIVLTADAMKVLEVSEEQND